MTDLKDPRLLKHKKAIIISASAVILAAVVLVLAFTLGGEKEEAQTMYKEATVQRGDLTVGINETGTAAVQAISVSYDITATIEKLNVKAGQRILEGDELAVLSTDSIQDEIDKLNLEYQKTKLQLDQSLVDQQLKKIDAKYTYQSNEALEDAAPLQYDATVDGLNSSLSSLRDSMNDLSDNIEDYEDQLDGGLASQYNISSLKKALTAAKVDYAGKVAAQKALVPGDTSLDDEVTLAKSVLDKAQQDYDTAYAKYSADYENIEKLLDTANDKYDEAQLKYNQQYASLSLDELSAESKLNQALTTSENAQLLYNIQVAQINNDIATAQLNLKTLEIQIDDLKESLNDATVKAPCSGTIMSVGYLEGASLVKGTPIVIISNTENVYVNVSLAQEDINSIELGKAASVALDAFEGVTFDGVVDSISTSPARGTSSTVSYTVTVKLSGDTSKIYEGMTGDVTFISKQKKDVIYVSNRAVTIEDKKQFVKIKDESGNPKSVQITTGFSDGSNVEVLSGLAEGDIALIESKVAIQ